MKKVKSLSELFKQARKMQPVIPVSEIKSLVESGKTSPLASKPSFRPRRITQLFNPLKLIIMITPIAIITATLLILNPGNRQPSAVQPERSETGIFQLNSVNSGSSEVFAEQALPKSEPPVIHTQPQIPDQPDKSITLFTVDTSHDPKNTLRLSSEIFKCFGFSFDQGGFSFTVLWNNKWQKFSLGVKGKEGFSELPGTGQPDLSARPSVCILSVQYRQNEKIHFIQLSALSGLSKQDSALADQSFNPINPPADLFIPVKINDTTLSEKAQNCIFWIYPNESFFSCLPNDIGEPMRREFNYQKKRLDPNFRPQMGGSIGIGGENLRSDTLSLGHPISIPDQRKQQEAAVEETEPVPCVYFSNLCESLSGLEYVNLYPNPATDRLTVDLVLQKAKQIRFRVLDLSGRLISDEGAAEDYPAAGKYTYQTDVSKLMDGFYMMVMTDEEGAKVSRRFIKN